MTYWLSRAGATQAEGPYTPRQIQTMWSNGQITAEDQLCPTDVEDGWLPAEMVVEELEERAVARQVEARPKVVYVPAPEPKKKAGAGCLKAVIVLTLLFVILMVIGSGDREVAEPVLPPQTIDAQWQSWEAVADVYRKAGAQVLSGTSPRRMTVVIPVALARQLSDYELKTMTQAGWSRLPDAIELIVEDELGTRLARATAYGVKVSR
jgi:hypothetical protein